MKLLKFPVYCVINTGAATDKICGKVMNRNFWIGEAPSIEAASYHSPGIDCRIDVVNT